MTHNNAFPLTLCYKPVSLNLIQKWWKYQQCPWLLPKREFDAEHVEDMIIIGQMLFATNTTVKRRSIVGLKVIGQKVNHLMSCSCLSDRFYSLDNSCDKGKGKLITTQLPIPFALHPCLAVILR